MCLCVCVRVCVLYFQATIAHLKEVIKCLEYDSKKVSACKAREEELEQKVKSLSEKLEEAEKHHTPVSDCCFPYHSIVAHTHTHACDSLCGHTLYCLW